MSRRFPVLVVPLLGALAAIAEPEIAAAAPPDPEPSLVANAGSLRPVVLESSGKPVTLELRLQGPGGELSWSPVCTSPCRAAVWAGAEYRIAGPGVKRSEPFVIAPSDAPLLLRANPGSLESWIGGLILTPVGGATVAFGALYYGMQEVCVEDCNQASKEKQDARAAATTVMVIGAAAVVTGIVLIVANQTTVTQTDFASRGVSLGRGIMLTPGGIRF